ncbi:hypothetical protein Q3G72_026045 [Acer saccharum]|nr:hypothetical protein Q3G72_026045 [Acer saccharum]
MTQPASLFDGTAVQQPEPWSVTGQTQHWRPLQETLPVYGTSHQAQDYVPTRLEDPDGEAHQSPEEARAQGYAEGLAQAKQEMADKAARLHEAIAHINDLWERQVRSCEEDMARLALVVAEEILLTELPARKAFTVAMAQHAMQLMSTTTHLSLRLSHADAAHLRQTQPELCARPGLRLIEDIALADGGVIAECPEGRVDASVIARLRAMCRALVLPEEPR